MPVQDSPARGRQDAGVGQPGAWPGNAERMRMSVKDKKYAKLGRRRIWPSILVFVLFLLVCVAAFSFLVYLCAMCIMGTKIAGNYEEAMQVGIVFDELMADG